MSLSTPRDLARRLRRALAIRRLRARIERERSAGRPVRLHLGCGERLFEGWINLDRDAPPRGAARGPDVLLDLSLGLPVPEASVDRIHSEDFLEHIDREAGLRLIRDCRRALRPGGVMRLLTPDLRGLVDLYVRRDEAALAWYRENLGAVTFGDMLNAGMRAWGHRHVYDEESLVRFLTEAGFRVERRSFRCSDTPDLAGLDGRNSDEGSLSMYLDCHAD